MDSAETVYALATRPRVDPATWTWGWSVQCMGDERYKANGLTEDHARETFVECLQNLRDKYPRLEVNYVEG